MHDETGAGPWPRITILMPCLNGVRHIGEAADSVRRQRYPDLEHIVLDAGSTDGTLEILGRYAGLQVISEPDEGAHDAMNKGIRRATGEIIGFLNVDDLYPDGLLAEVGRAFAADPELDVVTGGSVVFEDDGRGERRMVVARDHANEAGFWLPELAFGAIGFNNRFYRRRVFARIGDFNNDYFIAADRHFLIRIALAGLKAKHLGRGSIWLRLHAGSRTINPQRRFLLEMSREYIRMAREFARTTRGDRARRRVFMAWHAFESAKLALRSLRAGRAGEALRISLTLALHNPLWPAHLLHATALRSAVRRGERYGAAAQGDPRR
jgi:glycosyltransferase involved in cell wall biosynthesis